MIAFSGCKEEVKPVKFNIPYVKKDIVKEKDYIPFFSDPVNGVIIIGNFLYKNSNITAETKMLYTKNKSVKFVSTIYQCSGDHIKLYPLVKNGSYGKIYKTIEINNKSFCLFLNEKGIKKYFTKAVKNNEF